MTSTQFLLALVCCPSSIIYPATGAGQLARIPPENLDSEADAQLCVPGRMGRAPWAAGTL